MSDNSDFLVKRDLSVIKSLEYSLSHVMVCKSSYSVLRFGLVDDSEASSEDDESSFSSDEELSLLPLLLFFREDFPLFFLGELSSDDSLLDELSGSDESSSLTLVGFFGLGFWDCCVLVVGVVDLP